jgi:hypothetical protein
MDEEYVQEHILTGGVSLVRGTSLARRSCVVLWALLLGRDGAHLTDKKFTIVRMDCV